MVCQAARSLLARNLIFSAYMLRKGPPLIAFFLPPPLFCCHEETHLSLMLSFTSQPSSPFFFIQFNVISPFTPPFFTPAHIQQFSQFYRQPPNIFLHLCWVLNCCFFSISKPLTADCFVAGSIHLALENHLRLAVCTVHRHIWPPKSSLLDSCGPSVPYSNRAQGWKKHTLARCSCLCNSTSDATWEWPIANQPFLFNSGGCLGTKATVTLQVLMLDSNFFAEIRFFFWFFLRGCSHDN